MGHPGHHANEEAGQAGTLINLIYNRDAQCHSHSNFIRNGLPVRIQKEIAAKLWGAGAIDEVRNCTPMNPDKAKFAVWALLRKELHDSLTLCNWMYPLTASPLKARNYEGDNAVEAQLYSAITGDRKSAAELDLVAERIFNLHRALTIRDMGTAEMRTRHDTIPDHVFEAPKHKRPFEPGVGSMDRKDMEKAKDLFYQTLGWDQKTGAPTRATLDKLGLKDVADKLAQMGLLPA